MRYAGVLMFGLFMCGYVLSGELDFTTRDSAGKPVTWSISKPECDVRDGTQEVMTKFGLTKLKLLPMCGEKVVFFEDKGVYDGIEYTLKGAEYHGPWGVRCAYAVAEGPEAVICPRDIEVALHVTGKFRYCLWGGNWMCRQVYEQETADGPVIDGTAAIAMQKKLRAAGVSEAAAVEQANEACKKEASLWMKGSVVKDVPLKIRGSNMRLQLISSPNSVFYATIVERTEHITVQEPRIVQRSMMEQELAKSSQCLTVKVDKNSLTEDALRKAGVIGENEKLTKVLFREQETSCTDNRDLVQSTPLDVVMVSKVVDKTISVIHTYPVNVD